MTVILEPKYNLEQLHTLSILAVFVIGKQV